MTKPKHGPGLAAMIGLGVLLIVVRAFREAFQDGKTVPEGRS